MVASIILLGSLLFPSQQVTAAIKQQLAATQANGAAVAILRHHNLVYSKGFGLADAAAQRPVDAETRFEIGSDTKQFTAAGILQLKERGKLALDDRLSKYAPDFPHAAEVTLRELLNQTTGLPDYLLTNHFIGAIAPTRASYARIVQLCGGSLHFVPGSRWEYSNTNYIALGRVIENVSGETYEGYIRKHLFEPAGMIHSATIADEATLTNLSHGYWRGMRNAGTLSPAPAIGNWAWSAGCIVSTVGDLAKWDLALESGKIISAQDFAVMTSPATLADGTVDDYGFGWWIENISGHRVIDHDGDTYGFSASNYIFEDDDLTVIVLENEGNDAAAKVVRKIVAVLYPSTNREDARRTTQRRSH